MHPNCRTCASPLGALDNTGEPEPECIRCWLGLEKSETPRERVPVSGQLDLFGGERHAG